MELELEYEELFSFWIVTLGPLWLAVAGGFLVFWQEYWNWRTRIQKEIVKDLSAREPRPADELVHELTAGTAVPAFFAEEYLEALSACYGVEVGRIRPDDVFGRDLAVEVSRLPDRIQRKVTPYEGCTDAGNLEQFLCWEWDCGGESRRKMAELEKLARHPEMTVSELCRKLYSLEA